MRTVLAMSLACGACGSPAHTYNAAPDEGPAEPRLVVSAVAGGWSRHGRLSVYDLAVR